MLFASLDFLRKNRRNILASALDHPTFFGICNSEYSSLKNSLLLFSFGINLIPPLSFTSISPTLWPSKPFWLIETSTAYSSHCILYIQNIAFIPTLPLWVFRKKYIYVINDTFHLSIKILKFIFCFHCLYIILFVFSISSAILSPISFLI